MLNIIKKNINQEQFIQKSKKVEKTILYQIENCICKIYKNNKEIGIGFFRKIPFKNNLLKVLITNNHILNENDIENNKILEISIINNKKKIRIKKNKIRQKKK